MAKSNNEFDELENFEEIEGARGADPVDLSNIYSVKEGGFGDKKKLRTYITSLSVGDLHEDATLYEMLSKEKEWPISQIIQREVDKIRVSNISTSYILGEGRKVKYFPPIILALLPLSKEGSIQRTYDFNVENSPESKDFIYTKSEYRQNERMKELFLRADNVSLVDGLFILEISKAFDFKLLTWDRKKFCAVVIDGQHRLEALFRSSKEKDSVNSYLQDVVFLDFSPLIKQEPGTTPIEAVRRVFVDINTNAKKVGFVRQILMDDKDLSALCVQSLVDSVNPDGSSKTDDRFIKPQIVDWHGESLKHKLPHLTGVLSLYQIIDDYLIKNSLNSINDFRSPVKVGKWVQRINDLFMVDAILSERKDKDRINKLTKSYQDYLDRIQATSEYEDETESEYKETELFRFDYRILDIARDKFQEIYVRPLVKFFHELVPYKKAIDLIEEKGGFSNDQLLAKALTSSRNTIANSRTLREEIGSVKGELEKKLNHQFFLLYTVLGQKAIFYELIKRIVSEVGPSTSEPDIFKVTDQFKEQLNKLLKYSQDQEVNIFSKNDLVNIEVKDDDLYDLGTISSSFWEGIIYENNNIIYNTQGVRSLSYLIDYFIMIQEGNFEKKDIDLDAVPYIMTRIERILKKRFNDFDDEKIHSYSSRIIKLKSEFVRDYFEEYCLP